MSADFFLSDGTYRGASPSLSAMPAGEVELLARVSWSGSDGHGHTSYTDPVTYFVDQSGEVTVPAGNRSFSPDGDGVEDTTDVGFTLASQGTVTAEVLQGDTVVRPLLDGETGKRSEERRVGKAR